MTNLLRSLRLTLVLVVILGLVYPLVVTGFGRLLFPSQANGSLVRFGGRIVGSRLIAQAVNVPGLFHPRPSAVKYAGNGSGGSNLGPTNPALFREVGSNLAAADLPPGTKLSAVPPDMVESSASGLDPDITPANARLQIPRIARSTGLSRRWLWRLVLREETGPFLGLWGQPMVNVWRLNLALLRKSGG